LDLVGDVAPFRGELFFTRGAFAATFFAAVVFATFADFLGVLAIAYPLSCWNAPASLIFRAE
jgi:hypothetical protein